MAQSLLTTSIALLAMPNVTKVNCRSSAASRSLLVCLTASLPPRPRKIPTRSSPISAARSLASRSSTARSSANTNTRRRFW